MWGHVAVGALILGERYVLRADSGYPIGAALVLTLGSLVFRMVRGSGEVRRQMALPVLVAVTGVVGATISGLLTDSDWIGVSWSVALTAGVPVAIAVAILRYRLYDLDRLVSRTVTYTLAGGMVAALYAVPVLSLSRMTGGSSDLVVAASTLAAAAAFNPIRRRLQHAVDRRFDRARYDTQREVDALAGRLRAGVTLDAATADVGRLIRSTLGPHHAAIWIRDAT